MVLKTLSIKLLPDRAQEIEFQELSDSFSKACKAYMHADVNASKNIRLGVPSGHHRASVNKPLYSRALTAKSSAL